MSGPGFWLFWHWTLWTQNKTDVFSAAGCEPNSSTGFSHSEALVFPYLPIKNMLGALNESVTVFFWLHWVLSSVCVCMCVIYCYSSYSMLHNVASSYPSIPSKCVHIGLFYTSWFMSNANVQLRTSLYNMLFEHVGHRRAGLHTQIGVITSYIFRQSFLEGIHNVELCCTYEKWCK